MEKTGRWLLISLMSSLAVTWLSNVFVNMLSISAVMSTVILRGLVITGNGLLLYIVSMKLAVLCFHVDHLWWLLSWSHHKCCAPCYHLCCQTCCPIWPLKVSRQDPRILYISNYYVFWILNKKFDCKTLQNIIYVGCHFFLSKEHLFTDLKTDAFIKLLKQYCIVEPNL